MKAQWRRQLKHKHTRHRPNDPNEINEEKIQKENTSSLISMGTGRRTQTFGAWHFIISRVIQCGPCRIASRPPPRFGLHIRQVEKPRESIRLNSMPLAFLCGGDGGRCLAPDRCTHYMPALVRLRAFTIQIDSKQKNRRKTKRHNH